MGLGLLDQLLILQLYLIELLELLTGLGLLISQLYLIELLELLTGLGLLEF